MITFVINYIGEEEGLALANRDILERLYRGCNVITIKDEDRLKSPPNIGKWIKRYLSVSADGVLFKLDPDTSPISTAYMGGSNIFAAVRRVENNWFTRYRPHFGAIGFPASARSAILNSGMIDDPQYKDYVLEGVVLTDIFKRLNLNVDDRPDFCCGRSRQINAQTTFYHP